MQRVELAVNTRDAKGKGAMRRLRAEGAVPAVVYGSGSASLNLSVDAFALNRLIRDGINRLIDLTGDAKGQLVLVKEIQRDPVSQRLVHVDFYQVDTKKTIHVSVPVHYEGKPHGVEMGGVLETLVRDVQVECLPLAIPEGFTLDVSALDIGDALHASDFVLPDGVSLLMEGDVTVIHVVTPRVVEEPTEEGEEGEAVEGAEGAPAAEGAADAPAAEGAEKATG